MLLATSACGAGGMKAAVAMPGAPQPTASVAGAPRPMVAVADAPQAAPQAAPSTARVAEAQAVAGTQVSAAAQAVLQKEQRVIEGSLVLVVEDVHSTTAAVRARVESMGGRVMDEQLGGDAVSRYGRVQVKLPPDGVDGFLTWLEGRGELHSKRIQSTDVSRQLVDQVIALENLQLTLDRLRALLDRQGLSMQEILAIEQQMTRLRGEIERIKGEKRWLEHRVALATLTIDVRQREDAVVLGQEAEAKLYPGPRAAALYLLDANGRERLRLGAGAAVHLLPRVSLEVDVFGDPDDTGNAVLATVGGATYSDFLGRGRRRFFNPYLGLRLGFGYLGGPAFAFGAGAGVELFKHEYVLVDVNLRAMGLAGRASGEGFFDTAVVAGGSVVFAF